MKNADDYSKGIGIGSHAIGPINQAAVKASWEKNGNNISAIAREVGITRKVVRNHLKALGIDLMKPMVGGDEQKTETTILVLPPKGRLRRFLLTSAQNNTHVNEKFWNSLTTLAEHYDASIMVGTYSYNTNAYGKLAVKAGKVKEIQTELWFDSRLREHIVDSRIELARGLVWCGEMNILPTAEDPLSGLETYTHRKSSIFPHAKMAMRSIATMQGEGTKLIYTTGTVTVHNYIQKKAGLKAEHHHIYAALLVEVNSDGDWWVRQVAADKQGKIQDLDVMVDGDEITSNNHIEAITWGDLHATISDPSVVELSQKMLDTLRPRHQFLHDILEGASVNHHEAKNPHALFKTYTRGLDQVANELLLTMQVLGKYERSWCKTVVVDSNHDAPWVMRWLKEHDYRFTPQNAILFLETQLRVYKAIEQKDESFHVIEYLLQKYGFNKAVKFLRQDESFTICGKRIECGMHGHLGPNGSRGNPRQLAKVGRRANTAHTHSAGIFGGLYVAGTSSKLKWDYSRGPSSWSHSHILTYQGGQRAIVTMYKDGWRGVAK